MCAESTPRDYERQRRPWRAIVPNERLMEFTGDDRDAWLQGQTTNDLRSAPLGERVSFCLCDPKGRIQAVADAWRFEDRTLVSTLDVFVPAFLDRVERFVIMEDVDVRETDRVVVTAQDGAEPAFTETPTLPNDRFGGGGFDQWMALDVAQGFTSESVDVESIRIEAGVPRWGVDFDGKTLPPELGPEFDRRYVSYHKGCYTGQEVLMRLHSRGHTNETLMRVAFDGPVDAGSDVLNGERKVGLVTSVSGKIGLARLRNDAGDDLIANGIRVTRRD